MGERRSTDRLTWDLEGDLRQAFENYTGSSVAGPWDDLIATLAGAISAGAMSLETAARLSLLLARTQGGVSPDTCETCKCPCPGMVHR